MHISLIGINHTTTPVAIREKVAISVHRLEGALASLRGYMANGVIVSTCSRTEILTIDREARHAEEASLKFLTAQLNTPGIDLGRHIYILKDEAVIEHLFRVAAGLDSMLIGEFEVLGQVRQALAAAEQAGMVNLPLRNLLQSAIRTGRRVRKETGISRNALSVSSVAVDLAARVLGELTDCGVLVIGAGEAGKLAAKAAKQRGANRIVVISRKPERAAALAAMLGGVAAGRDSLLQELGMAQLVITCAGAPGRILDVERVREAMKNRPEQPLVILDIGVPRDVEPAVGGLNNVFLYNIDDLTQMAESNRRQREDEIDKAVAILDVEVDKFAAWWRSLNARPVVRALMRKAEEVRYAQLDKTLKKLCPLSSEERESLEAMTKAIVTKILKEPLYRLKSEASDKGYAEVVSRIFRLDEGELEH